MIPDDKKNISIRAFVPVWEMIQPIESGDARRLTDFLIPLAAPNVDEVPLYLFHAFSHCAGTIAQHKGTNGMEVHRLASDILLDYLKRDRIPGATDEQIQQFRESVLSWLAKVLTREVVESQILELTTKAASARSNASVAVVAEHREHWEALEDAALDKIAQYRSLLPLLNE